MTFREKYWKIYLRVEGYISALLYPHAAMCPICGEMRLVDEKYALCEDCMKRLDALHVPHGACDRCLSPVRRGQGCNMCRSGRMKSIDRCYAPFNYRAEVRKLVHEFKFEAVGSFMPYLSLMMTEALVDRDYDYLVPVPLNEKRLLDRGVNQARLLADGLSEKTGIPVMEALDRKGYQKPQSATPMEKRAENVKGIFHANQDLNGLRILLIDDVRTTGSTAQACAEELKRAGAAKVGLCTLAVVYRDPKKFRQKKRRKKFMGHSNYIHKTNIK